MMEERRAADTPLGDTARILAILYTVGYFGIVFMVMLRGIPPENKDAINQLLGALTIIQTGIVGFYFGGSKANERTQLQAAISKDRTDTALVEIAKAAPMPAVAPPATPAAATDTSIIPAAEVQQPPKGVAP